MFLPKYFDSEVFGKNVQNLFLWLEDEMPGRKFHKCSQQTIKLQSKIEIIIFIAFELSKETMSMQHLIALEGMLGIL